MAYDASPGYGLAMFRRRSYVEFIYDKSCNVVGSNMSDVWMCLVYLFFLTIRLSLCVCVFTQVYIFLCYVALSILTRQNDPGFSNLQFKNGVIVRYLPYFGHSSKKNRHICLP